MLILEGTILIMLLVVIANIISHYIVFLPTALIEIAIGLLVTLVFGLNIELESDWFMLLFVAPLLFNDAKHYPKKELWELKSSILGYAIVLVFVTTFVGGYFVHWLIPSFPLPLAMALIAVLSPTDPVAVQSIAEQVKLPKKIMGLISGESLINDASGLIAFKYALAAFMTGYFSIFEATTNFFYMAIVGGILGIVLMIFIHVTKLFLVKQGIQDVILHSTIQLLTPFVIFMVAEFIHASGVIAVVAAGFTAVNQKNPLKILYPEVRLVTNRMWDILVYLLNGIVFVLLGAELPIALTEVIESPDIHNTQLILYIFMIWAFLLLIRIVWSYGYVWFNHKRNPENNEPSLYTALLTGLTGVRGAVTMATIMSMPFILNDGSFFEQRPLMVALACGVVITSLIVASFALPILTNSKQRLISSSDDVSYEESEETQLEAIKPNGYISEMEARKIMTENVIHSLKEFNQGEDQMITADLIHEFQMRLKHLNKESIDNHSSLLYSELEKQIQTIALEGEREALLKLLETGTYPEKTIELYLRRINIKQKNTASDLRANFSQVIQSIKRRLLELFVTKTENDPEHSLEHNTYYQLEIATTKGAIQALKEKSARVDEHSIGAKLQKQIINQKVHEYIYKLQRLKYSQERHAENYNEKLYEYYNVALYTERKVIHDLYSAGKIPMDTANKLRQSLSYYETSIIQ